MAVTTTTSTPGRKGAISNSNSADLSGTEILRAAPASGISIYLRGCIICNGGTAQNVTIGEGETGGAVTTIIYGPIYMAANSQSPNLVTGEPVKLTAATALTADASGTTDVTIISEVEEKP